MDNELKPGTRVRMTRELRTKLRWNGSRDHVREFGRCEGIVQGLTDYNNCSPSDPSYDPKKMGPEFDVRWEPSGLRYAYDPKDLEVIP